MHVTAHIGSRAICGHSCVHTCTHITPPWIHQCVGTRITHWLEMENSKLSTCFIKLTIIRLQMMLRTVQWLHFVCSGCYFELLKWFQPCGPVLFLGLEFRIFIQDSTLLMECEIWKESSNWKFERLLFHKVVQRICVKSLLRLRIEVMHRTQKGDSKVQFIYTFAAHLWCALPIICMWFTVVHEAGIFHVCTRFHSTSIL